MIRPALLLLALALPAAAPAAAATLVIRAEGAADGVVYAGVCDRSFDEATCPYRGRAASKGGRAEIRIQNVRPGRYAVAAFLDANGTGRLDKSFIGLPAEPYGFSNEVGRRGIPSFEGALVEVRDPASTVVVQIR
jgi:uncharacterized protein (DUF2141 family)